MQSYLMFSIIAYCVELSSLTFITVSLDSFFFLLKWGSYKMFQIVIWSNHSGPSIKINTVKGMRNSTFYRLWWNLWLPYYSDKSIPNLSWFKPVPRSVRVWAKSSRLGDNFKLSEQSYRMLGPLSMVVSLNAIKRTVSVWVVNPTGED